MYGAFKRYRKGDKMTRKQYESLMKKKNITRTQLAIKLKCSLSSINFIMYGLTQKGKIKEAMDKFLKEV